MSALGAKADIVFAFYEVHIRCMHISSPRSALAARASVAHLIGLIVVGFYGTVGTTAGFGHGAWVGTLAGGIISIPWFATLCLIVWFFADCIERHIVAFCIGGPILVCGSWWTVVGDRLLDDVAISSLTASVIFFVWTLWERHKKVQMT